MALGKYFKTKFDSNFFSIKVEMILEDISSALAKWEKSKNGCKLGKTEEKSFYSFFDILKDMYLAESMVELSERNGTTDIVSLLDFKDICTINLFNEIACENNTPERNQKNLQKFMLLLCKIKSGNPFSEDDEETLKYLTYFLRKLKISIKERKQIF